MKGKDLYYQLPPLTKTYDDVHVESHKSSDPLISGKTPNHGDTDCRDRTWKDSDETSSLPFVT